MISSFIPFPTISWWQQLGACDALCLDKAEHFEKMSYRNRYYITSPNGRLRLSIPLLKGRRQQHIPMEFIEIDNSSAWQLQHWRSLEAAYRRSAFFEYYEPSLKALYEKRFTCLSEFNLASLLWVKEQLKLDLSINFADTYKKDYGAGFIDLRHLKPSSPTSEQKFIQAGNPEPNSQPYYQVFSERNGFLSDLSILDLIFSEGPHSKERLRPV